MCNCYVRSNDSYEGLAERERAMPLAEFEPGNFAGSLTSRSASLSAQEAMRLISRFHQAQCTFLLEGDFVIG
jgi:hypothetical protein